MSEPKKTRSGQSGKSGTTKKTTAGAAKASTGKKTAKQTAKKTATAKTSADKKTEYAKKAVSPAELEARRRRQRTMWIFGLFIAFCVSVCAVFGMKGFIMEPIGAFLRGLFGIGAYIFPFACLSVSAVLLFSKDKPVLGNIISIVVITVLLGSIEHLIFSKLELNAHYITGLYKNGMYLKCGGLISGGIAMLLSAAISKIGAILVVLLLLGCGTMYLCGIRTAHVLELILDAKDKYVERKNAPAEDVDGEYVDDYDEEYDDTYDDYDDPESVEAPVVKAAYEPEAYHEVPVEPMRSVPYDPYKEVRRRIDIPLGPAVDSADTLTSGDEEIPVSRIVTTPGMKLADMEPSVAKFSVSDPDGDAADAEEIIELTPIRKKKPEDVLADLPFDLDDTPVKPVIVETPAVKPEPVTPTAPVEKPAEEPQTSRLDVEVKDTHQEKQKSLGEKALKTVQTGLTYPFPPIDFLKNAKFQAADDATEELRSRSQKLNDTLQSFGIEAKIINVTRGPSVTRYEMQLDRGVKISRLTTLQDDIALALGAESVRIAPIPDKSAVGIEVPNKVVQTVYIRDVLTSREMANMKSKIAFAIGKDIAGTCVVGDIGKMPHMLIAGTTGSGKSVCINSIIVSILYRATPDEVKLIMIDPKMVELGNYNGIPHLLIPVVTDYKKAAGALNWAVVEMERRYKLMSETGVRDLASYNKIAEANGDTPLPKIVIIIDELADLMMTAAKEVEESICRIAQKARAAGMHLIIATQRPSADVLTGLMKSNIPSRIAFTVSSQIESRIILDTGGAEKLIGRGDMLYSPIGIGKPVRIQGCFLSDEEIEKVIEFIKQSGTAEYSQEILDHIENSLQEDKGGKGGDPFDDEADEMFFEAVDVVMETKQASASMLQRKLKLGYARASRIIDQMEERGIIGGYEGSKPRAILISRTDWQEMRLRQMD